METVIRIKKNTAFVSSNISNIVGEVEIQRQDTKRITDKGGCIVDITETRSIAIEELAEIASNNTVILKSGIGVNIQYGDYHCVLRYSGEYKLKVSSKLIEDILMVMSKCVSSINGACKCIAVAVDGEGKPLGQIECSVASDEKEEIIEYLMEKYDKYRAYDVANDGIIGTAFKVPVELIEE